MSYAKIGRDACRGRPQRIERLSKVWGPAGSPCRTRGGRRATKHHTARDPDRVGALLDRRAGTRQQVVLTVHELKRLARDAAELMTLSKQLQTAGVQLELLTGPLTGIYDPQRHGRHGLRSPCRLLPVAAQLDRKSARRDGRRGHGAAGRTGPGPRRHQSQDHFLAPMAVPWFPEAVVPGNREIDR
ncbi:recombinase family protein [Streptomyces sp. P1-3]|uniref:recombinase family protein n=1 Tax=Streptomyces sp. P1-3 TaxID=3421658 RepID=UPI003D36AE8E